MKMKEKTKYATEIVDELNEMVDYDFINKTIDLTGNSDIGRISKKTLVNISSWALNGASDTEIRNNLELSDKQFKVLCSLCPTVVWIMQQSRERADILVAGSLLQRALGGQIIHKKVPMKMTDYEDGRKIGEHIEYAYTEEELPPDSMLLKYIAEHKLSEKFGKSASDDDKEVISVVNNLTPEQIKELEEKLQK